MTFLARKISRPKWDPKDGIAQDEVAADALMDLKTSQNTLSFWEMDNEGETLWQETALALAASNPVLDAIDVVWLERDALASAGIALRKSVGETPVVDLRDRHVDAEHLDGRRLLRIAEHVALTLRDKRHKRVSKAGLVDILTSAVKAGRVVIGDLQGSARIAVDARLSKESGFEPSP